VEFDSRGGAGGGGGGRTFTKFCRNHSGLRAENSRGFCTGRHTHVFERIVGEFTKYIQTLFLFQLCHAQLHISQQYLLI
jgi:hypothetical protein